MAEDLDPTVPSKDYKDNQSSLAVIRTVLAGTEAMRAAGERYLPKHPAEKPDLYSGRLAATVLNNRLEGAVNAAVGKPMQEPVRLDDAHAYDPFYDDMILDVDNLGNDLAGFARSVFEDAVAAGVTFIMVDMPRAAPGMTLAEEIAGNIRPYFIHLRAEDVLSYTVSIDQGVPKVVDARFREDVTRVIPGTFKETIIRRVRHWRKDGWTLYEEQTDDKGEANGKWSISEQEMSNALGEVSIVAIFTGRRLNKSGIRVKAPFLDLAWKNVEHWQSSSDQRHILKYARFPILAGSGVKIQSKRTGADEERTPVVIGPTVLLTTEDPAGKWYYVEPQGSAIESGQKDLERLEAEMDKLSMKVHIRGSGEVTAREVATGEARENSAIKNMALNLKEGLEKAFVFAERLRGAKDTTKAPKATVHTDFGDEIAEDNQSIDALTKARVAGQISRRTYWNELQRRGQLSGTFDADAEEVALDEEESRLATEEDDPESDIVDPPEPVAA